MKVEVTKTKATFDISFLSSFQHFDSVNALIIKFLAFSNLAFALACQAAFSFKQCFSKANNGSFWDLNQRFILFGQKIPLKFF